MEKKGEEGKEATKKNGKSWNGWEKNRAPDLSLLP